ncbi:A disintegrin and metalloproteinase with thrombospondin motifs 5-like [Plakobranchus ocellatus]|uniref:A disintegrin and metalloproteinase with thrombospondin motifs 5-like n=1 Tax=Plakobranchus ocellatus TaxID=259542 RepID=A0AAV3YTQ0_9GAST|nr:A disintegrin and metalloproteinase with thrombospondin motifs 5-like [Plakobranchus ocellatus]
MMSNLQNLDRPGLDNAGGVERETVRDRKVRTDLWTATKYVVEGYIVIDPQAVDIYRKEDRLSTMSAEQEILHDVEFFLTYVNEHYKTLRQYGLDIEIRIRKMEVMTTGVLNDINLPPKAVSPSEALEIFEEWLTSRNAKNRIGFDFALLYTGVTLRGINGVARLGSICGKNAVTVIKIGVMGTAPTTAHELGHILGAQHDGKASFSTMHVSRSYDNWNRFSFSECTAHDFRQNFAAIDHTCLLETKSASYLPNVPLEKYKGRLQDPDEACRRNFGLNSYACDVEKEVEDIPAEHVMCTHIYCSKGNGRCGVIQTTEGMPCDKDKICNFGKCVSGTKGQGIAKHPQADCTNKQSIYIDDVKTTCEKAYKIEGGSLCINKRDECCELCAEQERLSNIPGCYGDSSNMLVSGNRRINCEEAIDIMGTQYTCTNSFFSPRCCQLCEKYKGGKDCPYEEPGIKWSSGAFTPCDELSDRDCARSVISTKCCRRCKDYL